MVNAATLVLDRLVLGVVAAERNRRTAGAAGAATPAKANLDLDHREHDPHGEEESGKESQPRDDSLPATLDHGGSVLAALDGGGWCRPGGRERGVRGAMRSRGKRGGISLPYVRFSPLRVFGTRIEGPASFLPRALSRLNSLACDVAPEAAAVRHVLVLRSNASCYFLEEAMGQS